MRRVLSWSTFGGGVLLVAFWTLYFAGAISPGTEAEAQRFESAFPIADALLAIMLFIASRELRRGGSAGPLTLGAAAAMTLYLGLLDVTYYGRAGLYTRISASVLPLAVSPLFSLGGGAAGLWSAWRLSR